MSSLVIRRMVAGDLDRVMEIAQSLRTAPHWPRAAYLEALDSQGPSRRIALVAEPEPGAGVVLAAQAVAGFAVARLVGDQAELELIAVAIEGQRRGVARHLLAALVAELRQAHVTEVILEVRASNHPALALYRGLGFSESGLRPRYYIDPIEDAVLMNLPIG